MSADKHCGYGQNTNILGFSVRRVETSEQILLSGGHFEQRSVERLFVLSFALTALILSISEDASPDGLTCPAASLPPSGAASGPTTAAEPAPPPCGEMRGSSARGTAGKGAEGQSVWVSDKNGHREASRRLRV